MDGIINYAGLARKIRSELEVSLGKNVNHGAIVMALKRLAPDYYYQLSKGIKGLLDKLGDFTVRSNLTDHTYCNSTTLLIRQKDILEQAVQKSSAFYSFNQGSYESTIVASKVLDQVIDELLKDEKLIQRRTKLAAITIILPSENIEVSGLYYYIFRQLAWADINVIEVISTTNEFTVVVNEDEVERGFQILRRLKR